MCQNEFLAHPLSLATHQCMAAPGSTTPTIKKRQITPCTPVLLSFLWLSRMRRPRSVWPHPGTTLHSTTPTIIKRKLPSCTTILLSNFSPSVLCLISLRLSESAHPMVLLSDFSPSRKFFQKNHNNICVLQIFIVSLRRRIEKPHFLNTFIIMKNPISPQQSLKSQSCTSFSRDILISPHPPPR